MSDLISRSKLIKFLESRKVEFADDTGIGWNSGIETAIRAVEKFPSVVPKSEWISIKDRLPDVGTRNIVARYDYVTNTQFWDLLWYDGFWWNRLIKGDFAVTHWMPLPEPPEGEEE